VKPLPPPESHHLRAALGWLELGNSPEAIQELERITPQFGAHPDVLELRWQIHAEAKHWDACVGIGQTQVELAPDQVSGWLHRAYALRRAKAGGLQMAWDALLPAAARFPEVPLVTYNLACYACQLGRLPEARDWLKQAFAIAQKAGSLPAVRALALDDSDLEPLWHEIREA
jgi:tetratricopeptide (TPR) repeat protein